MNINKVGGSTKSSTLEDISFTGRNIALNSINYSDRFLQGGRQFVHRLDLVSLQSLRSQKKRLNFFRLDPSIFRINLFIFTAFLFTSTANENKNIVTDYNDVALDIR